MNARQPNFGKNLAGSNVETTVERTNHGCVTAQLQINHMRDRKFETRSSPACHIQNLRFQLTDVLAQLLYATVCMSSVCFFKVDNAGRQFVEELGYVVRNRSPFNDALSQRSSSVSQSEKTFEVLVMSTSLYSFTNSSFLDKDMSPCKHGTTVSKNPESVNKLISVC